MAHHHLSHIEAKIEILKANQVKLKVPLMSTYMFRDELSAKLFQFRNLNDLKGIVKGKKVETNEEHTWRKPLSS